MRSRLLWLVPVALFLAVFVGRFFRTETAVAETFPVLTPEEARPGEIASAGPEVATFGSGCFWCSEAFFQQLKGVLQVQPGYSGGAVPNPTYELVCTGATGHAEAVQVTFDPRVISYPELLEVFWRSHDPTTLNRQGHDTGTQYRSVVFTHSDRQKELAELYRRKIDEAHVFPAPVVTEIVPFTVFYPAEPYHQNYFAANPRQPYCRAVIAPKVEKLREVFRDRLKPSPE
jgi:peptide-methionine (S)-S-oxide reductase